MTDGGRYDIGRGRQVGRKVDKKQLMYRPFDSFVFVRKAVKQENQQMSKS